MTANEDARCPLHDRTDCSPLLNGCNRLTSPDTSPTPVDLDALEAACKETGQGLWHDTSLALIAELRSARIELADEIRWRNRILDRSRASIGPDSERIREVIADSIHVCERIPCPNNWAGDHCVRRSEAVSAARRAEPALRAKGHLPGPGDIVVSREALRIVVKGGAADQAQLDQAVARLRAALSQPQPEETP